MYKAKIVIADDESMLLESIKFAINNYLSNVQIVKELQNGKDVLEYLNKNSADILIMDIRMPIMNGLEVLKALHTSKNKIKTILITAYKDFEYAYEAIQYGCYSFLTKPLDYEKLLNDIEKICSENNKAAAHIYENTARIFEKRTQQRSDLNYYFNLVISFEELLKKQAGLEGLNNECAVVDFKVDSAISKNSLIDVCEINDDFINVFCLCNEGNNSKIVILSKCDSPISFRMHVEHFLKDIQNILEKSYNIRITQNVSWFSSLENIYDSAEEKSTDEIADMCMQYVTDFISERQLYLSLYRYSFDNCKVIAEQAINKAEERFMLNLSDFAEQICSCATRPDICKVLSALKGYVQSDIDYRMHRVRQYIYDHCGDNLKMENVAENFNYNYSYFSRTFKDKNGRGFSDFIVYVRVRKAQQLLLRGLSVEQVAAMIGYEANYFKKKFKLETGMTVKEFLGINDEKDI